MSVASTYCNIHFENPDENTECIAIEGIYMCIRVYTCMYEFWVG